MPVLVNLASVFLMVARNDSYKSALVPKQPHLRIRNLNCSLKNLSGFQAPETQEECLRNMANRKAI